jgi:hypothetical protein
MPAKPKIEDFERVLVVEGHGDLYFYAEMLKKLNKYEGVFIQPIGGKSKLPVALETFINPGLLGAKTHIGFIVDADDAPEATRDSLQAKLAELTGQRVFDGQWTGGSPKIGLFVVPGGDLKGEIETLVWNSWANDPKNIPSKNCVEGYVACMSAAGHHAHSPDKGLIGALLAIRSDEDPRLGPGARRNVFDLARPELQPLRHFLDGF